MKRSSIDFWMTELSLLLAPLTYVNRNKALIVIYVYHQHSCALNGWTT
jgi:hypothetical protein